MSDVVRHFVVATASLAVGIIVGAFAFALFRLGRWYRLGRDRAAVATDPTGGRWTLSIGIFPRQLGFPASQRLSAIGREELRDDPPAKAESRGHRSSYLDPFVHMPDEAGGLVFFAVVVVLVVAVTVLAIEIVLVIVGGFAISVVRAEWNRWRCDVTDPDGYSVTVTRASLKEIRVAKAEFVDLVTSGRGAAQVDKLRYEQWW
jgi:hypothetical protein